MRLFAAIDLPEAERERLLDWLAASHLASTDLRLVPSDQWHLTLAFYGEVAGGTVPELTDRLRRACERSGQVSLAITGIGSFPNDPARAKVLWLGVDGDLVELGRLADRCSAAGRHTGLELERRKYRPHLTIGRPRHGAIDLRQTLEGLPTYAGKAWLATTVRLMRSHLGPMVRHETLEEIALG